MSNKTSDKNVANVEVIKNFILELKEFELNRDTLEVTNALEELVAEREQMLKEREKYTIHLTDEEYRKVIANAQKDVANDSVIAHKFAVMQQQIDKKDKRIKVLEAKNKYLESLSEYQHNCLIDSIPKHEVKDEIDVHTNLIKTKTGNTILDAHLRDKENYVIDVLQKILKKGEK